MQRDKGIIAFAAEKTETDLWAIEPVIQQCGVRVIPLSSADELLAGMHDQSIRPTVVLLSATCANGRVSDTISRIKEVYGNIPVVVVVRQNSFELERETRRAGIFYYLTLPAERNEIEKVVLSALRARERHGGQGD